MESVAAREERIAHLAGERAMRRSGAVEDRALTRETLPPVMFSSTSAGPAISPRSALNITDAYSCIRALADAAATLPLHVYRRAADGGRERADGPTAALLARPAPGMTQAMLVAQLMVQLNLFGECFVAKYRDGTGNVAQIGLLSPDRVGVRVVGGLPLYDVAGEDGTQRTFTSSDLIHVRGLTLDGLRGISPVAQAREALGLARALAEHGASVMANSATPHGLLSVPAGPAGAEAAEALAGAWRERHRGPSRAGSIGVLQGDISFHPLSMPLADLEFLQQREHSTREVARIFRVPSWLINGASADSLTYSTVSESMRAFVLTGLKPLLVFIEQALAADEDLFPIASRTYPSFELDGLLRGDPQARAAVYTAALSPDTGWMTRSEVRALEDLPAETMETASA